MSRTKPTIIVSYWAKPVPFRQFDWQATYEGDAPDYDDHTGLSAMAVGYGETQEAAIADLIENYPRS